MSTTSVNGKPIIPVFRACIESLSAFFRLPKSVTSSLRGILAGTQVEEAESTDSDAEDMSSMNSDMDSDEAMSDYDDDFQALMSVPAAIHDNMRSLLLRDVHQLRQCGYKNIGYLTNVAEKG